MATLFETAFDNGWLSTQVQTAAAASVTYARGAETATVTAVVGRTVFASNAEGAARVEFGDRDYLILAADLVAANANWTKPAIGDRITDSEGRVFEVVTPDTGEPAWRYSDPQHTTWRIHTKRQRQAEQ